LRGAVPRQVYIKSDKSAQAALVPGYLVGMEDPRAAPAMQTLSFYRFFAQPKTDDDLQVSVYRVQRGAHSRSHIPQLGSRGNLAPPP
jgi:hypothetical protein